MMFLRRISVSTKKNHEKILKGITDRKQIYFHKDPIAERDDLRVKCLIHYNSRFKICWELIMAMIYILSFWLIPINIATDMEYF